MRFEQCHLVHHAHDKCIFIRNNCPDEEAGLISYLQLYYCKLSGAKPVAFVILVLWLGLLFSTIGIAASDFFCINLSTIASILGMSESLAGVTFLAFGNGSPDVFSTFAAMKTHSGSLAIGELIGAAGFITAVVAGSMALVRPFKVARKSFVRDVGFFIVAASFSMVFLADGKLYLWECAVMVGFYLFYVVTVVLWHWYLSQRGRKRLKEAAARGHFYVPGFDDAEPEPYHDEEEDRPARRSRTASTISRGVSADDFAALERAGSPLPRIRNDIDPDEDDETRDHWLAEISSNMRVSRPRPGERRNTPNPIRPSLVGALEFRAVLSSLQKSRNIQTIPISLRRYSDDPTYTLAQQQAHFSSASSPVIHHKDVDAHSLTEQSSQRVSTENDRNNGGFRVRAVSANDAAGLKMDPGAFQRPSVPDIDFLGPSPPASAGLQVPQSDSANGSRRGSQSQPPLRLSVQPPQHEFGYLATSPGAISSASDRSPNLLAPPGDTFPGFSLPPPPQDRTTNGGPHSGINITRPSDTQASSPISSFPEYRDDPNKQVPSRTPSLRLPPPSLSSDSPFNQHLFHDVEEKPLKWWPYRLLPPPQVLASTLFPTLYSWKNKNIWEKLLGIVSAPSVFVLAITLPVVETERDDDDDDDDIPGTIDPDPGLLSPEHARSRSHSIIILPPDSPSSSSPKDNTDSLEPSNTNQGRNGNHGIGAPASSIKPLTLSSNASPAQPPSSPKDWNRWLVCVQIFTAPLFIVLILWANTSPTFSLRTLALHSLYALLASSLTLIPLLLLTTPSTPPCSRPLLCFLGFIVAIAWISTIANEVVGVLKALGVILGISDAILGLTIFAVGNSSAISSPTSPSLASDTLSWRYPRVSAGRC